MAVACSNLTLFDVERNSTAWAIVPYAVPNSSVQRARKEGGLFSSSVTTSGMMIKYVSRRIYSAY